MRKPAHIYVFFRQPVRLSFDTANAPIAQFLASDYYYSDGLLTIQEVDGSTWAFVEDSIAGWQVIPPKQELQNPNGLESDDAQQTASLAGE